LPISVLETRIVEMNTVGMGIPLIRLMEAAGKSVADTITSRITPKEAGSVVVLMGRGGNGGDSLVAARYLDSRGYSVTVVPAYRPELISSPDTRANYEIVSRIGTIRIMMPGDTSPLKDAGVIVDGLLGTGVRGELREPIKSMVEEANNSKAKLRVAIDTPTGVDPDTGEIHGLAFKADVTVTFHDVKKGLLKAKYYTGEIIVANIGIPREAAIYVGPGDVAYRLPGRPRDAHKGSSGRVVIVGGSYSYTGAPSLAGLAALKAGVDLSFIITPEPVRSIIASYSPELITIPYAAKNLSLDVLEEVEKQIESLRPHVVVVGPGLGRRPETLEAARKLLSWLIEKEYYIVIDADALKSFKIGEISFNGKAILTPHRGEFSTLTGVKLTGDPREDTNIVKDAAGKLKAVILLKAPIDIISDGSRFKLNRTGNPYMAIGGTGDVLTGITAAFLARTRDPFTAAYIAAYVNGLAGDLLLHRGEHVSPTNIIGILDKVLSKPLEYHMEAYDIRVPQYNRE
jgi:hydroxyethylthiazole kinase-like uncharacterized protein yjeF